MKKLISILFAGVAVVALNGCGGGSSDYYEEPYNDGLTTLFLVNEYNEPVNGIEYICDSMANPQYTAPNGEFSFYPGETCEFDFFGLNGTDPDDLLVDDIIYIVDDLYDGKGDIPYQCDFFNVGSINYTYSDGSFEYDWDDRCAFFL